MRILDKYLLRTFLTPWLSCLLGFTFLFVILDLVESLNKFLDANVSPAGMLVYYLRFLPSIWIYIGPITLLLGLLYALYQLTRNNEIVAMRSSGISLYRVLTPFIVLGALISLFSMYISAYVAPRNLAWTEEFLNHMENPDANRITNMLFRDPESNRTWKIDTLNLDDQTLAGVTIFQFRPGEDKDLEYVLEAEKAVWVDNYWFFHEVDLQPYSEDGYRLGSLEHRPLLAKPEITESPGRIIRETMSIDFMTSPEMRAYLRDRPSTSDRTRARIRTELHMRRAHPWLCLVTMLMAVPFGTQTARKGVFVGVALCMTLFFSLFFMMNLFKALGLGQKVDPWAAGWTPTLLFACLGAYFLRRLR